MLTTFPKKCFEICADDCIQWNYIDPHGITSYDSTIKLECIGITVSYKRKCPSYSIKFILECSIMDDKDYISDKNFIFIV